jgi:Protein of unknown function (DUF2917)
MQIPLSFKRMFLAPGKTFAVPTVAGSRVRVVDGMVWATTSNNPDDVWLGAGDEHIVQSPGLTVVESVAPSTIELLPPAAIGPNSGPNVTGGHIMNRYEIRIPRAACHFAAIAMTAITIGLAVVLPAKISSDRHDALPHATSNVLAATPDGQAATKAGGTVKPLEGTITQASSGVAPPTRVQ